MLNHHKLELSFCSLYFSVILKIENKLCLEIHVHLGVSLHKTIFALFFHNLSGVQGSHQPANFIVVQHDECFDVGPSSEERLQKLARLPVAVVDVVVAAAPGPVSACQGRPDSGGHLCKGETRLVETLGQPANHQ